MITALTHYLESIRDNLRLELSEEREVISELETHIEDRFQELREAGLSEEEAAKTCLGLLGSAKLIAKQIYEAHSQGTWRQTLLASMPHLLFGILFALNWWHHIGWLSVTLVLVLGTAIYGWWHGKPTWVFPWLGYTLLPVIVAGLLLLYLPEGWSWLAIAVYIPLALWWLYSIIVQTIRRDWLLSSVMLLPIPMIVGWFLAIELERGFTEYNRQRLYEFAPWIGLSFLALALSIAAFVRLRQRWLKIGTLVISGLFTLAMVAYYAEDRLSLAAFLVLILAVWGLFLIPAVLERWLRGGERRLKSISTCQLLTASINSQVGEVSNAKGSCGH
jgi:hypothetical protein